MTRVLLSSACFYFSDLSLIILDLVVLFAFHLIYSNVVIPRLCSIMWNIIRWPKNKKLAKLKTIVTAMTNLNSRISAVLKNFSCACTSGSCSL